ncbi:MAG: undecaprenyl-diphosphate phosphatase [Desulfocapsaceae bacterium]|nr:undecaprenyl-diphosphate phosphatase [Desulfocapsaceae bacterium]
MEFIKAVVLGIVQGLTEFLPISSSGHLVIGSEILDFQGKGVAFDVFLHMGTLLSVVLVFRKELAAMLAAPFKYMQAERSEEVMHNMRWNVFVVISVLPAVVFGLYLKDSIEMIFSNLLLVFSMLFITGVLMISSRYLRGRNISLQGRHALIMGCAQAMAIMPGLSRSGSTIFAGMAMGVDRQVVARFSFIMSIPAILGAMVLQLGDLLQSPPTTASLVNIAAGTAASALSGYLAIILLLDVVRRNRLQWFGYYCLVLSGAGFLYFLLS